MLLFLLVSSPFIVSVTPFPPCHIFIISVAPPFHPPSLSIPSPLIAPPFPPLSLSTSLLFSFHHISVLLLHSLPPHHQHRFSFPSITSQCCFSIPSPFIVVASFFLPSHLSVASFPPPSLSTSLFLSLHHICVAPPFPPPSL